MTAVIAARVICVGNRHVEGDDIGPRVFDRLAAGPVPAGIEIIDGGLGGLNLLRWFDGVRRVVLVDAVAGFGTPGQVLVLDGAAVAACCADGRWGHDSGLPYLLAMLPRVYDGIPPDVFLVGVETPGSGDAVAALAAAGLALAAEGMGGPGRE